jgi:hypothetical protein
MRFIFRFLTRSPTSMAEDQGVRHRQCRQAALAIDHKALDRQQPETQASSLRPRFQETDFCE